MSVVPTREQVPQITRPVHAAPPQGAAEVAGAGISARDILKIVRKRWKPPVFSLLIIMLLTVGGTIAWLHLAPIYGASALLEVQPPTRSPMVAPIPYGSDIMDMIKMSAAQMIKSESILSAALENPDVQNTYWFKKFGAKGDALTELKEELAVTPLRESPLIKISLQMVVKRDDQRKALPVIVNAVAAEVVSGTELIVRQDIIGRINELQQERNKLDDRLDKIRNDMREIKNRQSIPNIQERHNTITMRLRSITTQLTELELAKANAQSSLQAFEESVERLREAGNLDMLPEITNAIERDPTLRSLRNAEINLVTERERLISMGYGPEHRARQENEARLKAVRSEIETRKQEVIETSLENLRTQYTSQLSGITQSQLEIQNRLQAEQATFRDLETAIDNIKTLQEQEERILERLDRIDSSLVELRPIARRAQRVSIYDNARTPRERSHPQWKIMLPAGFVLSLVVGFGLTFLMEFMDTSVKSPSDIARKVDMPLLGIVPHTDDLDEEIKDHRLIFMTHPHSPVVEAFRQIRTSLVFSGPVEQRRSMVITSPLPGDGRTTVAMNLAASLARSGRKVLVVDTNFHRPGIHKIFPECPKEGLSAALSGQVAWTDVVHEVEENLCVINAGALPDNSAELLGSEKMRDLISEMTAQYDHVFFDSAPCLVVTDPAVLSTLVDGVIMVVRAGENTYGVVQRSRNMLVRVGARVNGAVLNGVRTVAGGYLRETYERFYTYPEQVQLPSE